MPNNNGASVVARILNAISHAGSPERIGKIGNSKQAHSLTGSDQQIVAAAVSDRVLAVTAEEASSDRPGSYLEALFAGLNGAVIPPGGA